MLADPARHMPEFKREVRIPWARDMLARLNLFGALPRVVPVGLHALQIARGVRLIGLEGESVSELGTLILKLYPEGVTFPLGYTDGTQLYLPVARMLAEGGYEVLSYIEYHWPALLAIGGDALVEKAILQLQQSGLIPR